jgi:glycosyltransferase involved in cell wall biosynthesis
MVAEQFEREIIAEALASSKLPITWNLRSLYCSMRPQARISVCIPCYNGATFLGRTIQSLLDQTFTDFSVVVIDDKSTDNSVSIIERFADPRIQLSVNDSNLGIIGNWSKVLSCAQGRYVKLLCGDDVLYPECLARQVEALETHSNAGVVLAVCNREVIDAQDRVIFRRGFPFKAGINNGLQLIRSSVRWGSNLIGEPAVGLFRREALSSTKLFENSNPYLVDLTLWAELLRNGNAFVDKDYLAGFRISGGATSARVGFQQAACFRSFVRNLRSQPLYGLKLLDTMMAYILSFQWCLLRNVFINSVC